MPSCPTCSKVYQRSHTCPKPKGQYFTTSPLLQQFVFDHVRHRGQPLLEPSFGAGHLLSLFDSSYPITGYEIDSTIPLIIPQRSSLHYADFLHTEIAQRFPTIIGNPPYVKKREGNLYIQFIEKCYDLLTDTGEMIFIVPSEFLKQTRTAAILTKMTDTGSFTHFLFPHDETLFPGAAVDVMAFRYQKGPSDDRVLVNDVTQTYQVRKGILTFTKPSNRPLIADSFHVYVGLVSGRDEIYRTEHANIDLLIDQDTRHRFLFPEAFPTENPAANQYLEDHKDALLQRKIRKFTEKNWWEWGAPRNLQTIRAQWGKPCIYVRNITRQKKVAFVGTVQYFGGGLLCMIPKEPISLDPIVEWLNTDAFQKEYRYAGRFKMGQKQLLQAQ
jgi:adenine-specific DNA-methyltransferase